MNDFNRLFKEQINCLSKIGQHLSLYLFLRLQRHLQYMEPDGLRHNLKDTINELI